MIRPSAVRHRQWPVAALCFGAVVLACGVRGREQIVTPAPARRLLVEPVDRGADLPLFAEEHRRLNEETRAALAKRSGLLAVPGAELEALEAAYDSREGSWQAYLTLHLPDARIAPRVDASCSVGRGERLCAVSQGQSVVAVEQAVELRAWIEAVQAVSTKAPVVPTPTAAPPPSGPCRDRAVLRTRPPYDAIAIASFGAWHPGCEPIRDALEPARSAFASCDDGGVVLVAVSTDGAVERCEARRNLPHAPPPCLCEAARTVRFPRGTGPRRAILAQVAFLGD